MRSDVVDCRGHVPLHEQFTGNVKEEEWADHDEQQVIQPGDSPWIVDRDHVPSGSSINNLVVQLQRRAGKCGISDIRGTCLWRIDTVVVK